MQRWWFVGAGLIGLLLAFVLIPKPDTGGEVAAPAAKPAGPPPSQVAAPGVSAPRAGVVARPGPNGEPMTIVERKIDPSMVRTGPNPYAAEVIKQRSRPESVYAGQASAPFTLIRRQLLVEGSEDGKAFADEAGELISALRENRRTPDTHPWEQLESRMTDLAGRLRSSRFTSDPQVTQSLDRLDTILAEYKTAKENYVPEE